MATTLNEHKNVWRSGDWKDTPRRVPPYNGIEITGIPSYDQKGNFDSARIIIKDCTLDQQGVTSEIEYITLSDDWVWIPAPAPCSPPDPSGDPEKFTVRGEVKLRHGSNMILLRIRLKYGLEYHRRDELGFILEFFMTGDPAML